MRAVDKIILESVVAHRLDAIAKEMGVTLEKSSRSPIFAEACDFACGICNHKGDLVSQLNGIPILAAAGAFSVRAVLEKYREDIHDGDVFIINDPYLGGNHLPDIGIITPVFYSGELTFFTVSRAHHGDIGGSAAGSYNSRATEIFQEGLRIPPLRLATKSGINQEMLSLITYNTRNPQMLKSDLFAQMGANRIGQQQLIALMDKYGLTAIRSIVEQLLQKAEELTREAISRFPPGTYSGEEYLDDDGFQTQPVKIKANVTFGQDVTVDFTCTDPQVTGFVNSSLVTTSSAAYMAVLWALSPEIPRNSGAFRMINIKAPIGTVVNPREPAPVTLSTLHCACEIVAAVLKACAQAVPEKIPAGFGRYCGPSFYGTDPRNNKFYVGFAFCCLGSGGGVAGRDGLPYMAPISNYGGVRTPNNETNELQYPILTLAHHLEPDTGGPGKYRGAPGIKYQIQFYGENAGMIMFGDGMKIPPYGLQGGQPGSLNRNCLESGAGLAETLPSKSELRRLHPGDVLTLLSSGGGGWGNPLEREPELVWQDYKNGLVSPEKAMEVYRVIISDGRLDLPATQLARKLKQSLGGN